jgi:hypothetical protein
VTPDKLQMDSQYTPCGVHVEVWLSVKPSNLYNKAFEHLAHFVRVSTSSLHTMRSSTIHFISLKLLWGLCSRLHWQERTIQCVHSSLPLKILSSSVGNHSWWWIPRSVYNVHSWYYNLLLQWEVPFHKRALHLIHRNSTWRVYQVCPKFM